EVLGIVSHIISKSGGNEGLGFVVTSNTVKRLLLDKSVMWAGVEGRIVSDELARSFKVPQPAGYLVTLVAPGSDAAALGLQGGTRGGGDGRRRGAKGAGHRGAAARRSPEDPRSAGESRAGSGDQFHRAARRARDGAPGAPPEVTRSSATPGRERASSTPEPPR